MVRRCNPGDGSDISALTGNPAAVRQRWEESFEQPVENALDAGIETEEAARSPIMEMIQAISVATFPLHATAEPRQLIIISDMLQHTEDYSQYHDPIDFGHIRGAPFFAHLQTDLGGVEVRILYARRPGVEHLQTRRHAEFWAAYIAHMGGTLVSVKPIDG